MFSRHRFGRLLIALVTFVLALGSFAINPPSASAATIRFAGTGTCQADGTYTLTWSPTAGITFSPDYPATVRTAIAPETFLSVTTAYAPVITATQVTMVVPGDIAASYRITMVYLDSAGLANVAVLDVTVDGTCEPLIPVETEAPLLPVPVCGPNNDTVTLPTKTGVVYTASGWVGGSNTITATAAPGYVLTGDTTWTFTDAFTPCPITTVAPTVTPLCGANNDAIVLPVVDGVTYIESGWINGENTVTATTKPGHVLVGDTTWTFTDANVACVVEVATQAPTSEPACGPANDMIKLPTTTGVVYTASEWVDGVKTVTATAAPGYVLTGPTTWTLTDANVACDSGSGSPTPTPTPIPAPPLPDTGMDAAPLLGTALALLVIGGFLIRRKKSPTAA